VHETTREDAGDRDVTRRTRLAAERTWLAWWRTGLAGLAVAVATGEIVPGLSDGPRWPWVTISVALALLGVFCIVYAEYRRRQVDQALARGEYATVGVVAPAVLAVAGATVGIAIVLAMLFL
jgi:putative membrane protein